MSLVWTIVRRTLPIAAGAYMRALAIALCVAAVSAVFAFSLAAAEGVRAHPAALWAVAAGAVMPVVCAFFGSDVWSSEVRTGRIELIMSVPVRCVDWVLGKFFAVWLLSSVALAAAFAVAFGALGWYAPEILEGLPWYDYLPAIATLELQCALWSAVAVAASTFFRQSTGALAFCSVVTVAVPRVLWNAMIAWGALGPSRWGEMPLDALTFDMASGIIPVAAVAVFPLAAAVALFVATRRVEGYRLPEVGGAGMRLSAISAAAAAVLFAVTAAAIAFRVDITVELPLSHRAGLRLSERTLRLMGEARGRLTATVFAERGSGCFREASHCLRALTRAAAAYGELRIDLRYVDPVLDGAAARQLVREGVAAPAVVFAREGRANSVVALDGDWGEENCAAAIARLTAPFGRTRIYWTVGHGEAGCKDYSATGLSTIARDLALDGYLAEDFDLSRPSPLKDDCALVVIAGARSDFSAKEIERLRAYLANPRGGRLLALLDGAAAPSLDALLSEWGMSAGRERISGGETTADMFAGGHEIVRSLAGRRIVFDSPVEFEPSAASDIAGGADRKRFVRLVESDGRCLAAAVERGADVADMACRPTRIVAVGDVGFALNGALSRHANANRDFLLNCVRHLSGRETYGRPVAPADRIVSNLTRAGRRRFVRTAAVVVPAAIWLALVLPVWLKRRR